VKLYPDACIVIAMNVTGGEPETENYLSASLYIYPDVVQQITDAELSFLARIYDHFDPHLRWDRIALISGLHNIGHRNFARPKTGQTSHPMSMRSDERLVLAFDTPRILERNQLQQPGYGQSLVAVLERKLK